MVGDRKNSLRLKGYDYSQPGAYFITILTAKRRCLLSKIVDGIVHLTPIGKIVEETLLQLPKIRSFVFIDSYVIMPNHIHIILGLGEVRTDQGDHKDRPYMDFAAGTTPKSLGRVVQAFKSLSAVHFYRANRRQLLVNLDTRLWHRNYHDRIIRSQAELDRIRKYIDNNPTQWSLDRHYVPDTRPQ